MFCQILKLVLFCSNAGGWTQGWTVGDFSNQPVSIYLLRLYAKFRKRRNMDSVVTFIGPFPGDLDIAEASFWKLKWNISTLDFAVTVRNENKL